MAGYGNKPTLPKHLTINDVKVGDKVYSSVSPGYQLKIDKIKDGQIYGKHFNSKTNWTDDVSDDKPIQYYYKTKEDAEAAHDADMKTFPAYVTSMSKELAKKLKKFKPGDKISGVLGSNFADAEFTVNSVNRNGTMDVTSQYGTPYSGIKPNLFEPSTKVHGKFKVGDKIDYGKGYGKYKIVNGPYKSYDNNQVLYDLETLGGKHVYKGEILPFGVTKYEEPPKSAVLPSHSKPLPEPEYKVGDLVKGHYSGNTYKIDSMEGDGSVKLVIQKVGPHDNFGKVGDIKHTEHEDLGTTYTKVEPEKSEIGGGEYKYKSGDIIKHVVSGNKYKVVGGPYDHGKSIGYDIEGIHGDGGLYKDFKLPKDQYAKFYQKVLDSEEPEFKAGDLVKGKYGNIYKIDKIVNQVVHLTVQKATDMSTGYSFTDSASALGSTYQKANELND